MVGIEEGLNFASFTHAFSRVHLGEILAGKEPGSRVGLDEFLALARVCVDILELDKLRRERKAIELPSCMTGLYGGPRV